MIWPFLLTVHIWKATSHSTAPTFLVSFTSHSHFVCSHRIVKDFGGTWKWYTVVSCPDPFRKNREGVCQHCHTTVCPARSVKCAPMRLQSSVRHVNRFVTDLYMYKMVLCRLTKHWSCLMLLRERMGSKKLLLKQKEIAEAFASGRDVFVSFVSQFQFFVKKESFSIFPKGVWVWDYLYWWSLCMICQILADSINTVCKWSCASSMTVL